MGWKERRQLSHVEDQVLGTCNNVRTRRVFTSEFEDELPEKEKDAFDLDTSEGRDHAAAVKKNKKAMMQFALSFQKGCPTEQTQSCNKSQ